MENVYIGSLIKNGNKVRAQNIFYDAMYLASKKLKKPYQDILAEVYSNCAPVLNLKYIRRSGQSHSIPANLTYKRSLSLTVKWVIAGAKKRKGKNFIVKLADELVEVVTNVRTSNVYNKRLEFHKKAVANRFLLRAPKYVKTADEGEASGRNKYFKLEKGKANSNIKSRRRSSKL